MADSMDFEILEDGTISVKTGKISSTNHFSADEFLREIADMTGNKRETKKLKKTHSHIHENGKIHTHSH